MVQTQTKESPSFETVWAALQEVAAMQKENERQMKENERIIKEYAERQMKEEAERKKEEAERKKEEAEREKEYAEWKKKTDWQMKKRARQLDKQIGKLGNRLGEMIEYMVMPNLLKKFRKLGFVFTEAYPHSVIKDVENGIYAEIDITLKNGDKVMIVEVKSKPTTEDITEPGGIYSPKEW